MTEGSDAELIGDHVAGSPTAFGQLVDRHQNHLWAVARGMTDNPPDAADVLQDALVKAFRKADTFRGEAAVSTWLHRIVVTTALDARRAAMRAPRATDTVAERPDPRDDVTRRETRLDVDAALASLADDQRDAVVLVDMLGLSVDEAAQALGCPPGTVKSRCFRARGRLATLLVGYADEAGTEPTDSGAGNRAGFADVQQGDAQRRTTREERT